MLAQASLATDRVDGVGQSAELKKVKAYVLDRLRRATGDGVKSSTLSVAIEHGLKIGNGFCHHMAKFWGMTYAELEEIATDRRPVIPKAWDAPIGTLLLKLSRDEGMPGLRAAIDADQSGRWRTSTVLRAIATEWESSAGGQPVGGWPALLDAIESGDIDKHGGGAKAAIAKAVKQTRGRPKIPPAQ